MVLNQGVSIQNELFLAFVSKPAENWLMHQTNKPTHVGVNPDRVKIAFGTSWCVICLPSLSPAENQNLTKYLCPQESPRCTRQLLMKNGRPGSFSTCSKSDFKGVSLPSVSSVLLKSSARSNLSSRRSKPKKGSFSFSSHIRTTYNIP